MAEQLSAGDPNFPAKAAGGGPAPSTSNPQSAPTIYSLASEPASSSSPATRPSAEPRPQIVRTAVQVAPVLSIRRPAPAAPSLSRPAIPARPSYRAEGAICLLVAIGWGIGAQYCYREVGTLMLVNALSGMMRLQEAPPPQPSGPGGVPSGQGMQQSLTLFPPDASRRTGARRVSPRDADAQSQRPVGSEQLRREQDAKRREREAMELTMSMARGEETRLAWAAATFVLTGLILAVALASLFRTTAGRLPPFALLCIVLGASAGGLLVGKYMQPPRAGDTWISWILSITQSRYSWAGHVMIAALTAVIAGLFALRPTSDPRRWLMGAVVFMFIGTFLTLAGISALETYGGFPPLPAWHYAVVAAGQSFFAWVLMVMLHWRHPLGSR